MPLSQLPYLCLLLLLSSPSMHSLSARTSANAILTKQLLQAQELRVFCDSSATRCSSGSNRWTAQAGILLIPIEANREMEIESLTQSIREQNRKINKMEKVIQRKRSKLKGFDQEITSFYSYEIYDREYHAMDCDASRYLKRYFGSELERLTSTESRQALRSLEKMVNARIGGVNGENGEREDATFIQAVDKLARMYSNHGRNEEAQRYLGKAIQGWKRLIGTNHPRTLSSVYAMAMLMERQGQLEKAKQMYQRVFDGYITSIGENHAHTLRVKAKLQTFAHMDCHNHDDSDNNNDRSGGVVDVNNVGINEFEKKDSMKKRNSSAQFPKALAKCLQDMHQITLNLQQKQRELSFVEKEKQRLISERRSLEEHHVIRNAFLFRIDEMGSQISSPSDAELLAAEIAALVTLEAVKTMCKDSTSKVSPLNVSFYMDSKATKKIITKTERGEAIVEIDSILSELDGVNTRSSVDYKKGRVKVNWVAGHPEERKPNPQSWSLNDYGIYVCDQVAKYAWTGSDEDISTSMCNFKTSPFWIGKLHVMTTN